MARERPERFGVRAEEPTPSCRTCASRRISVASIRLSHARRRHRQPHQQHPAEQRVLHPLVICAAAPPEPFRQPPPDAPRPPYLAPSAAGPQAARTPAAGAAPVAGGKKLRSTSSRSLRNRPAAPSCARDEEVLSCGPTSMLLGTGRVRPAQSSERRSGENPTLSPAASLSSSTDSACS
jgi:hypothetical protein